MGRLGDWDKVERKRKPVSFTKTDEYYEYFKMFLIVGLGVMYLWFIFSGWGHGMCWYLCISYINNG